MPALRVAIRETYERLFRDPPTVREDPEEAAAVLETVEDEEDSPAEEPPVKKLNYGQQVSKLFDDALNASSAVSRQVRVGQSYFPTGQSQEIILANAYKYSKLLSRIFRHLYC